MAGNDNIRFVSAGGRVKAKIKKLLDELASLLKKQPSGSADKAIDAAKAAEERGKGKCQIN